MGEVAADPDLLGVGLVGGAGGASVLIAEGQPVVDVVDDGLHPTPAGLNLSEQRPGEIGQGVGFTVAAAQQVDEGIVRQLVDRVLDSQKRGLVGQAAVPDQEVGAEANRACRGDQPVAGVAEAVAVGAQLHARGGLDDLGGDQVVRPLGPDAQHQNHRRRRGAVEGDLVAGADEHSSLPDRNVRSRQATPHNCEGSNSTGELNGGASDSTETSTCMCRKSAASPR